MMRSIELCGSQYGATQAPRVRGKCETVLVLYHMDWGGTDERLKARDESWKMACEKTEGAEYLGRYAPWNKRYHWTYITNVKDIQTWRKATQNSDWKREPKEIINSELEFYAGPQ